MMRRLCALVVVVAWTVGSLGGILLADSTSFIPGNVGLSSAGPIAFAPDGVLLVSDPMAATIYAVQTGDTAQDAAKMSYNVDKLRTKVAAVLGTTAEDVRIVDLAVNPSSGTVYLSVARGSGPDADAAILVLHTEEKLTELSLQDAKHTKVMLPNAPKSRQGRRGDPRMMAITDIAYLDSRVIIAGLSNEEFASKLHYLDFPFNDAGDGTSVEIFHGAHGKVETRSPIMTFCGYTVEEVPHVLAAYTCTPLVAFPVSALEPGSKVRGKTLAELGNRNRPLDMFVYNKGGKDFILMANNNRGMMKIDLDEIATADSIDERVGGGGTAGLPYEKLDDWQGVMQLDRLNNDNAVILIEKDGRQSLQARPLP